MSVIYCEINDREIETVGVTKILEVDNTEVHEQYSVQYCTWSSVLYNNGLTIMLGTQFIASYFTTKQFSVNIIAF